MTSAEDVVTSSAGLDSPQRVEVKVELASRDSSNTDISDTDVKDVKPGPDPAPSLKSSGSSSAKSSPASRSPSVTEKTEVLDGEEIVGGDVLLNLEPGKTPKLSRSSSRKIISRPAPLFDHLPDRTIDATSTFEVIQDCVYSSKYLGSSDQEALGCECGEEWVGNTNVACGDDSDCINRLTKIECVDEECTCGSPCQNQRFQQKQFAKVSVIQTEKKGFGLRADVDLPANTFIFEYIGDVINEANFRRRMVNYDQEGIKHFYFMSLQKGVFVDATKRGNLGRFCNHSCNPNCYVDKWVVGEKLRMGIFTERRVKAGEELVFNYNVDRYGADPQPCYCGEPNCTGFLGGKTQTERATKLPLQTLEALGIDDGDGWDTAVSKKPRKKKVGEDDEEYVDSVQPKSLDEDSVNKVMATLMQCKEKWIVVKLLGRIQQSDNERVRNRVVKMHGYQILNATLSTWKDDVNIVIQILTILDMFPRLTKNKITDSKIEATVEGLLSAEDQTVRERAGALVKEWSTLELGYRIPRRKWDANAASNNDRNDRFERRGSAQDERKDRSRSHTRSHSPDVVKPSTALNGARGQGGQRHGGYGSGQRPPPPRRAPPLPRGWYAAQFDDKVYYYSASGERTWTRPTQPAPQPPPQPKQMSREQSLQMIIDNITKKDPREKAPAVTTPQPAAEPEVQKPNKEKWRNYSEEKQQKLYENTLFPHIKYVMDKFKSKLPRDDLKRFGKEIAKKLVSSDYKNKRVQDPTQISSRQEKQVKKFVKEYFDKAVAKKAHLDKKKAERLRRKDNQESVSTPLAAGAGEESHGSDVNHAVDKTEAEDEGIDLNVSSPPTPSADIESHATLKRKREGDEAEVMTTPLEGHSPTKRFRSTPPSTPPPPPPPPPAREGTNEQCSSTASLLDVAGSRRTSSPSAETPQRDDTEVQAPAAKGQESGTDLAQDNPHSPTLQLPAAELAPKEAPNHFEGVSLERMRRLGMTSSS
ncbi:MAG: hypothetical protein M1825_004441 [Sarcosagium campestre]|nr:MAG: hypothetical protein M1825_004441 [Sarcosagium campestre]